MKKTLSFVVILTLLLGLVAGCGPAGESSDDGEPEEIAPVQGSDTGTQEDVNGAEEVQTVTSSTSTFSLDFPTSWTEEESLHDVATVRMASLPEEQYMIVTEETGVDFEDTFTTSDYAQAVMGMMETTVENYEATEIISTTVGNGISAEQFEMSGTVEQLKVKYLVTITKHDDTFYQNVAWSLQSRYDNAKPVFQTILDSLVFK